MKQRAKEDPADLAADPPIALEGVSRSLFDGGVLSAFGERDYTYLWGACFLITSAATNSVLQGCSDREMRGRVISIYIMVFIGVAALGGQLMGYISDVRSTPFSLFVGGLACIAVALVLIAFPKLIKGAVTAECQPPYEPWD